MEEKDQPAFVPVFLPIVDMKSGIPSSRIAYRMIGSIRQGHHVRGKALQIRECHILEETRSVAIAAGVGPHDIVLFSDFFV